MSNILWHCPSKVLKTVYCNLNTIAQGWEFALLLIRSLLFHSKLLIFKNESLSSFFRKERCEWFARDSSKLFAKSKRIAQNNVFFVCFWQFFLFFMYERELLPALFTHSLFFKERLERFAPGALYKRARVAIRSFSPANCTFALKKAWNARKTDERNS